MTQEEAQERVLVALFDRVYPSGPTFLEAALKAFGFTSWDQAAALMSGEAVVVPKERLSYPRGNPVLHHVVTCFLRKPRWTVAELVVEGGLAEGKELYNALGYLARKGRLTREGYGQYLRSPTMTSPASEKETP